MGPMTDTYHTRKPEQKREVTPLELLFDLVFAFAISQLSNHLLTHLSWRGSIVRSNLICVERAAGWRADPFPGGPGLVFVGCAEGAVSTTFSQRGRAAARWLRHSGCSALWCLDSCRCVSRDLRYTRSLVILAIILFPDSKIFHQAAAIPGIQNECRMNYTNSRQYDHDKSLSQDVQDNVHEFFCC